MQLHFFSTLTSLLLPIVTLVSAQTAYTNQTNGIGSLPSQRFEINLVQANSIITAAVAKAAALNIPQNVAVVNPAGLLIAFAHMDNAYLASIDISLKKARTSVLFNGIPSGALYTRAEPGGDLYGIEETNGGLVVFGGGLPIYDVNGHLLGGVGVSGGTVAQDVAVVTAGVAGLSPNPANPSLKS